MKYQAALSAAILLYSGTAQSTPPFYAQPAAIIQDSAQLEPGYFRLRILASLDENSTQSSALIGRITVCSESACFSPDTPWKGVSLYNTKDGKAEALVQIKIPNTLIKSIHFDPPPGQNAIAGEVQLSLPLQLPQGVNAAELVVFTKKRTENNISRYQPAFTAWTPHNTERQSVFYNPNFKTTVSLPLGASLSIPSGATTEPQVFSIAVHDVGDKFPLVDIYPIVQFATPASISAVDVRQYRKLPGSRALPDSSSTQIAPTAPVIKPLGKTGVIRVGTVEFNPRNPSPAEESTATTDALITATAAAATDTCTTFLRERAQEISASLALTGAVLVRGCENVPPYVHIAIANNWDPRETLGLTYNYSGTGGSTLALQKLENWTFGSQITINGFTWSGSSGITAGTGLARGFVQDSAEVLGSNRVNGGTTGSYDSNKLAFLIQPQVSPRWREGSTPPLWTTGLEGVYYPFTVISSSTSILKVGVCSADLTSNRWSALGVTSTNRLIFVSSTSEGATSAAELCPVFQTLDTNAAIRLDGSTAAGMTVDGIRRNPITGANALVYGSSRYIAYGLRVFYRNGAYPAATPVVEAPSGVKPTPRNPCQINPRLCQ